MFITIFAELNIVMDEIGPGEGGLDSGGIEIPLKPAGY